MVRKTVLAVLLLFTFLLVSCGENAGEDASGSSEERSQTDLTIGQYETTTKGNYPSNTKTTTVVATTETTTSTTHRFNVTRPSAYTSYNNQGIHYENDTLYVPLFGYNSNATPNPNKPKENVILVYGGIDNAIANTQIDSISNSKAVTIEAVNTDISLFEIESIGFPVNNPNLNNDLLWFNTNKKIGVDRVNGGIYCDSQDIK